MTRPLTGARRRALTVIAAGARHGQPVRVSNGTTGPAILKELDDGQLHGAYVSLTVYWQSADWLAARGYITVDHVGGAGGLIALTPAGRQLVDEQEATARG